MLVLTRRIGEEIVIGGNVRIRVVCMNGGKVRVGISAPESVRVDRAEVHDRRVQFDNGWEQPARRAVVPGGPQNELHDCGVAAGPDQLVSLR